MNKISKFMSLIAGAFVIASCSSGVDDKLTPQEARSIAKEAYIYSYPLVENGKNIYSYFYNSRDAEFKTRPNSLKTESNQITYKNAKKHVNPDTPMGYSFVDLRAQPIVVSMPTIEQNRYYSVQVVDLSTYIPGYIGTREDNNQGGDFMIVGPGYKGITPKGIRKVVKVDTDFALLFLRTQMLNDSDMRNVRRIQDQYKLYTLNDYIMMKFNAEQKIKAEMRKQAEKEAKKRGQTLPPVAEEKPQLVSVKSVSSVSWKTITSDDADFFASANFMLQFIPAYYGENKLRENFNRINVAAGKTFNISKFKPEIQNAIKSGMVDGKKAISQAEKDLESGNVYYKDLFGSREAMKEDYLKRALAAKVDMYGNYYKESTYLTLNVDDSNQPLMGGNNYTITFAKGELPPVEAFWSLTMYDENGMLVKNSEERYSLGSSVMRDMRVERNGDLVIYVQPTKPAAGRSNWLPSPANGKFIVWLRAYLPDDSITHGRWPKPTIKKVAMPVQ